MKPYLFFGIYILYFFSPILNAQYNTLVTDNFENVSKFIDNSILITWGSNTLPESCYKIINKTDKNGKTYRCLCLKDSALFYANYHDTLKKTTKALTCIDYVFGPLKRGNDTIKIEYDIYWDLINNSGEIGRINNILLHSYPKVGAKYGEVDSLNKFHPFGRPAYNFRVRNKSLLSDNGFIGYGGNNDPLGKLYIHIQNNKERHWLPGAIPNSGVGAYPIDNSFMNFTGLMASSNDWKHFTWIIYPEKMELYHRKSVDSLIGKGSLVATMDIPKIKPINYPTYYHWFDTLDAFRIYFYGNTTNTYLANVKIAATKTVLTSNNTLENEIFSVFPNPTMDHININCKNNSKKPVLIELFSLDGIKINETVSTLPMNLNLNEVSNGLYIMVITTDKNKYSKIIILNK